jgi:hypothetical protein
MAKLPQLAGAGNAGVQLVAKIMRTADIKIHPELSKVFEIEDDVPERITESMKKKGYDKTEPMVL